MAPSTEERFAAVRHAYDAFNRRDIDAFRDLFSADVVIHDLATMPEQQVFTGRDGIERFLELNMEVWQAMRGEIERLLEVGPDRVLALTRHVAKARGGTEVTQPRGVLFTFSTTGKIRELRFFSDPGEALRAVGMDEHTAV